MAVLSRKSFSLFSWFISMCCENYNRGSRWGCWNLSYNKNFRDFLAALDIWADFSAIRKLCSFQWDLGHQLELRYFLFEQFSAMVENQTGPSLCREMQCPQNIFFVLYYRWGPRTDRCFFLKDAHAHKVNWLSETGPGASFCFVSVLNLHPADRGGQWTGNNKTGLTGL